MIVNNREGNLRVVSVALVERKFNPDTYVVRLNLGSSVFFDSEEHTAEEALRRYRHILDRLHYEGDND